MYEDIQVKSPQPQGLIKVELFDELTSKKVEEVNTHNFISQGVLRSLFNAKVSDIFTTGRATNGHNVSNIFIDPFAQISLTTATHPEDPLNEWLRAGKLIGYAYSDAVYAGADTLRGSYNAAESFTNDEHVRMVFDFPTNAANGEFSSIYFHPKDSAFTATNDVVVLKSLLSIQRHNDKYYMLKDRKMEVYSLDLVLLNTYTLTLSGIRDFCIKGDEIYYLRYTSADTITKAPLTNPSATSMVINFSGGGSFGGLEYDTDNQQFIIADYSSSIQTMIYCNEEFVELKKEVIGSTGSASSNGVISTFDDFMTTGFVSLDKENNFTKISSKNVCGVIDATIYFDGHMRPKSFIGSRCLLDAPITKEPTQTMKITYDFVLPSIY